MSPTLRRLAAALLLAASGCGSEERSGTDARAGSDLEDLPIVEVPAATGGPGALAFIASGDGGWARLVQTVASELSAAGIPVVGLNTLDYYWQPRTPEESARALERILRSHLARWGKERILLVGYSRGAGVLPFMASRLPPDLLERVDLIAFLGLEPTIGFQFHYTDWFLDRPRADAVPVGPEVEKLRGRRLLCVYGADEPDSLCPKLPEGLVALDRRAGGHHFDGDYVALAKRILREARLDDLEVR